MLECVLVIIDIMRIVVGVGEERIARGENERGSEVLLWQEDVFRAFHLIDVLR